MELFSKLKRTLGGGAEENTYQCTECDDTFKSYIHPDDHWVKCDHCGSRDVDLIQEGS